MTADVVALAFAGIALIISVVTGKRLALVSAVGFFTAAYLPNVESYEATVISMVVLNFALFMISAMEYKRTNYPLPRALTWLFAGFVVVSASYSIWATETQGSILLAMSVIELILLASLEGCRNVWEDIKHTVDSVWRRHISAHTSDAGEDRA